MRVPEAHMKEAIEDATCREVYRGLTFRIWQIASERFEWNEELPPMPPRCEARDH